MTKKISERTYRKFTKQIKIEDYEVETDDGFVDIISLNETIPYLVFEIETEDGFALKCADKHIVFTENYEEIYAEQLTVGTNILTQNGISKVSKINNLHRYDIMYDLELSDSSNHRYYTNGILSHNTLLAKKLAEELFGDENNLIRIDMSEYSEKSSVAKLIGSNPGYVGFENGGQLTEAIKNKQHCVLLLDEIEKADQEVYNLFLQLFDEGRLTDSAGQTVNFKNVIVLMTSNVGAREANEFGRGSGFLTNENDNKKTIIEKQLKKKFSPEFLNRLDQIVHFNNLTDENLKNIVNLELNKLVKKMNEIGYNISWSNETVELIHKLSLENKEYGARPIIRLIQENIEDAMIDLLLSEDFEQGHVFKINVTNNKIIVEQ